MADLEAEKALAAAHAVKEVRDGMLVGLGTGSTAAYAVRLLGERVKQGLAITGTSSSPINVTASSFFMGQPLPSL